METAADYLVYLLSLDVPVRVIVHTTEEITPIVLPVTSQEVEDMIGAKCLDHVTLHGGRHMMWVDDNGHQKGLPVNRIATVLYWQRCGRPVEHEIVGDVVIVPLDE